MFSDIFMRGALVGRRTKPPAFTCKTCAMSEQYRSKYTHILNPTVREDIR